MAYEVRKQIEVDVDIDIEDCISSLDMIQRDKLIKSLVSDYLTIEEIMECFTEADICSWIEDNAETYGYPITAC